jgi:hypothetical protein
VHQALCSVNLVVPFPSTRNQKHRIAAWIKNVDNYFQHFFAPLKSVSTFEALLEEEETKSKKLKGCCKD